MSTASVYGLAMCPIGGRCGSDCGRTSQTCVQIWGSDAEHAEAMGLNAEMDAKARRLVNFLDDLPANQDLSIIFRRWLPGDATPEPCPHDSLSGDEGPIAELGRMPIWWRCDSCDKVLLLSNKPATCDCPMDPHHRWNCSLTPIWTQTIRDLDTNPWTIVTNAVRPLSGAPVNTKLLHAAGYYHVTPMKDGDQ